MLALSFFHRHTWTTGSKGTITIYDLDVTNLRFAYDTALIADDKDNLQKVVNKVKEVNSKAGLEINFKKTKNDNIQKAWKLINLLTS